MGYDSQVPVSWRITENCVLLESEPTATFDEWTAAVDAALVDEKFRPGMGVVHDLRRQFRVPTADEARERVDFLMSRSQKAGIRRWAIVVAGTAHYGMGRLAEFVSDGGPVVFRVFLDVGEAHAWACGKHSESGNVA